MKRYNIVFIFAILLLAACNNDKPSGQDKDKKKDTEVKYNISTVQKGGVASTARLPAQLAAYQEVSIFPKVNGYVRSVKVDIGSKVVKGALLMELEAPELMQAVAQARERYARTRADFAVDKERYGRLLQAAKTEGAVSPMDLSSVRAKMASDSALSNAEKANWEMQQAMTNYLAVRAPFTGVITERNVAAGTLVSATSKDKPMLELKDIAHLRLQVDVPEALASKLKIGDSVSFSLSTNKGEVMKGTISRKAGGINVQYRTERMEIDVDNAKGQLAAGMYADVLIHASGDAAAVHVPKTAVVTATDRKYVIVIKGGRTVKVNVTTGNTDGTNIEVYGQLTEGEQVIVNASDEIPENMQIHQ